MTANRVDQVTYEGQWAAYQKNYQTMSLAERIDYCEELSAMSESFRHYQKKRWTIFYWAFVAIPILVGLLFAKSGGAGEFFAYSLIGVILIGLGYLFTNKNFMLSSKTKLLFPIGMVGYSILSILQPSYTYTFPAEQAILFIFPIGIIITIGYFILSGSGFSELYHNATGEKMLVEEEIRRQLYSGPLNPIQLKTKVSLNKGESAYLEVPAMLVNIEQKNPYFQNLRNNISAKVSQYVNVVTGEKEFSSGMRKFWEQAMSDGNEFVTGLSKYSKKDQDIRQKLIGSLGSCIVTDDRVLFVTQNNGFQIVLSDLTAYYAQDGDVKTLVLQSPKGQRALEVESASWIVLLLDRLKRRV